MNNSNARIIVIGGVAAGASAAVKARRTNEFADIVLFEKGPYVSFANCGLPYYVGGTIESREDLILVSPELFKNRFNIDVHINSQALSIDPKGKTVTVSENGSTKEWPYDKLILGLGGIPVVPDIPGKDLKGVSTVFTLPDADRIMSRLSENIKTAVVIGGGFIGIETAEGLAQRGLKTCLVEMADQLLTNFDHEFSPLFEAELNSIGVETRLGASAVEILGEDSASGVELSDGSQLEADLVIMAVGVRPNVDLAKNAGIEMGPTGRVMVDAGMKTSIPDIYAAGDMVESIHLVTGRRVAIPLAGSANKQGRIAGNNAAGGQMYFKGVLGTAIIKCGGLTCARTGITVKEAVSNGLEYKETFLYSGSNASYYPGSESYITKLIFNPVTGRILGAQVVGRKGVDKRIDVYATSIYAGLSVYDLENLDLAYAPPYSSAKDSVVMSGMVASNIVRGLVRTVTPEEAMELAKQDGCVLLDVRDEDEFAEGILEGATNLPVNDIRANLDKFDHDKTYYLYCGIGYRAYVACRILMQHGFDVYNVSGGYFTATLDL